jgi:hypothetical protein
MGVRIEELSAELGVKQKRHLVWIGTSETYHPPAQARELLDCRPAH